MSKIVDERSLDGLGFEVESVWDTTEEGHAVFMDPPASPDPQEGQVISSQDTEVSSAPTTSEPDVIPVIIIPTDMSSGPSSVITISSGTVRSWISVGDSLGTESQDTYEGVDMEEDPLAGYVIQTTWEAADAYENGWSTEDDF